MARVWGRKQRRGDMFSCGIIPSSHKSLIRGQWDRKAEEMCSYKDTQTYNVQAEVVVKH